MDDRPGPKIADHAVIGDMQTVALVDTNATIDFLCWPRFDSPTIFASLLDIDKGGSFSIAPQEADDYRVVQIYLPDTNVLVTRFLGDEALIEITDLMPVDPDGPQRLVRIVHCIRGTAHMRMRCAPRFDYARAGHDAERSDDGETVLFLPEKGEAMRLVATVPLETEGSDAVAGFEVGAGQSATFLLDCPGEDGELPCGLDGYGAQCFEQTVHFWRDWLGTSDYAGRFDPVVRRSALVLKLMTSRDYGSIVAAPTFGLPETIGGARNWDYRYTWIRDAAFTVYAFVRVGLVSEADAFMDWIYARMMSGAQDGSLQIMYGIDGREELPERELDHLAGYAGSQPVRIGNAAYDQLQLDSYGALLDAVYLANKHSTKISFDGWRAVSRTVDWVCENWRRPDEGIWEFRGGRREFLSSRLMCWVAVDRAVRMSQKFSLPGPVDKWQKVRNEIHYSIFDDFWSDDRGAFVQYKGSTALDASCLLMPLVKFVSPTDPKWLSTLDAVGEELATGEMVRRYDVEHSADVDGLEGEEGSFTVCSFWYVECLARAGRIDEARLTFEKLQGYANHVGLYAEELGKAGEHLGNFPQALTHLSLISAATAIDRAIETGARS